MPAAIGVKVLDHIRVSPDTTDFTPIFNKIEGEKPDVMITGISHVGVQPTVQWKQQEVPIPMFGVSSAGDQFSSFWKDTNGATDGVLFHGFSGPDVAVTPKTLPFVQAFQKRFGIRRPIAATPPMTRSIMSPTRSSAPARPIPTSWSRRWRRPTIVGTIGRVQFKGKEHRPIRTRSRSAPDTITGLMLQWQNGKQVNLWPANVANGKLKFPSFIKIGAAN